MAVYTPLLARPLLDEEEVLPCPALAAGKLSVDVNIANVGNTTFYSSVLAPKTKDLTTVMTGYPRAEYAPSSWSSGLAPNNSLWGAEGPVECTCSRILNTFWIITGDTFKGTVWQLAPPPPTGGGGGGGGSGGSAQLWVHCTTWQESVGGYYVDEWTDCYYYYVYAE